MANAFSKGIEGYVTGSDARGIGLIMLDNLMILTDLLALLDTESVLSRDSPRLGFTTLYLEYRNIVIREFAVQFGLITQNLNLEPVHPQEIMTSEAMEKLRKKIFVSAMERLKLS